MVSLRIMGLRFKSFLLLVLCLGRVHIRQPDDPRRLRGDVGRFELARPSDRLRCSRAQMDRRQPPPLVGRLRAERD